MPWFDEQNVGALITKLTESIDKIESGIGEKVGIFIQCIIIFVSGLAIAFTKNWRLALVGCAVFPPIAIGFGILGWVTRKYTNRSTKAYERANGIASETLGAIRTIFAFEGQKSEHQRYSSHLDEAEKCGIKMSVSLYGGKFILKISRWSNKSVPNEEYSSILVFGMSEAFIYTLIAVTFYYGIVLLTSGTSNAGDVIMVSLC